MPTGTLSLSTTAGLTGSGDGTGSLSYSGPLTALDAALDGLSYTSPPVPPSTIAMSVSALSYGADPGEAQVTFTDGIFSVTTSADGGPGSLRQAIVDTDETPGSTTVDFAIPGTGVQTIVLGSPLPAITNSAFIDGCSQPGYSGTPLIELSGSQAGDADGLVITAPDVTVRGLAIDGFASGAGVLIDGTTATNDWIYADVIGVSAAFPLAQPNLDGVLLAGGAHDDVVGTSPGDAGATQEGNQIDGNTQIGVGVGEELVDYGEGFPASGAGLTLNGQPAIEDGELDLGNEPGSSVSAFSTSPLDVTQFTTQFRFQSNSSDGDGFTFTIQGEGPTAVGAGYLGYGSSDYADSEYPPGIGRSVAVKFDLDDGVTGLEDSRGVDSTGLYVDGTEPTFPAIDLSGTGINLNSDDVFQVDMSYSGTTLAVTITDTQTGASATESYTVDIPGMVGGPTAYAGFTADEYSGDNILSWSFAPSSVAVDNRIAGNVISGNGGPGVVVAGDGSTGNRITANRIFGNGGPAIDLGDDGVTDNAAAPRQGANNFQNFPIIVQTAGGGLEGSLTGSTPDTTFDIEFFASAAYGPGGSGEAQDYLGSLDVTTDAAGETVFAVPFTAPGGLPVVTATATDPQGNTSEVSALRPAPFEAPAQYAARGSGAAGNLLGDDERCHLLARPRCRTARSVMEPDALGRGGDALALEYGRAERLRRRDGIVVVQRTAHGDRRGA